MLRRVTAEALTVALIEALTVMGKAADELLATITGGVMLLVFGGVFVGATTPRVTAALHLSVMTREALMIGAGTVFVGTVIVTIIILATSASRRAR